MTVIQLSCKIVQMFALNIKGLLLVLCCSVTVVLPAPHGYFWTELKSVISVATDTSTSATLVAEYVKYLRGQAPPSLTESEDLNRRDCFNNNQPHLTIITRYAQCLEEDYTTLSYYQYYLSLVAEENRPISRTPFFHDLQDNLDQLRGSLEPLLCLLVDTAYLSTTDFPFCPVFVTIDGEKDDSDEDTGRHVKKKDSSEERRRDVNREMKHGSKKVERDIDEKKEISRGERGRGNNYGGSGIEGAGNGPILYQDTGYSSQYLVYVNIGSLAHYIAADISGLWGSVLQLGTGD